VFNAVAVVVTWTLQHNEIGLIHPSSVLWSWIPIVQTAAAAAVRHLLTGQQQIGAYPILDTQQQQTTTTNNNNNNNNKQHVSDDWAVGLVFRHQQRRRTNDKFKRVAMAVVALHSFHQLGCREGLRPSVFHGVDVNGKVGGKGILYGNVCHCQTVQDVRLYRFV
jgi:hypothetical protein